ncbi:MAG: thioesterase family protein [Pirellulales bacterium]
MISPHEITIRVRYQETDAQGHVHHANYFTYFELGRTEQLRAAGRSYELIEQEGLHLVVTEIGCRYFSSCRFGDSIIVRTRVVAAKGVRVQHEYEVLRGEELLAQGHSTVACVDRDGKPRRLPQWMRTPGAPPD